MRIAATVAVYPLGQQDFRAINRAIEVLRSFSLTIDVQPMHTEIEGEATVVFEALQAAFNAAAEYGMTILVTTLTNVCGVEDSAESPTTS